MNEHATRYGHGSRHKPGLSTKLTIKVCDDYGRVSRNVNVKRALGHVSAEWRNDGSAEWRSAVRCMILPLSHIPQSHTVSIISSFSSTLHKEILRSMMGRWNGKKGVVRDAYGRRPSVRPSARPPDHALYMHHCRLYVIMVLMAMIDTVRCTNICVHPFVHVLLHLDSILLEYIFASSILCNAS